MKTFLAVLAVVVIAGVVCSTASMLFNPRLVLLVLLIAGAASVIRWKRA